MAARLQADILGTSTLVVARTDAEAATYLTSNIDHRDHGYILGATKPTGTLNDALNQARAQGKTSATDIAAVETEWMASAELDTFPKLVAKALKPEQASEWAAFTEWDNSPSLDAMRAKAAEMLGEANVPYFDWEAPRAREGYYRLDKGVDLCVARAKAYAPHADLIWMETAKPILGQAQEFATAVHKKYPGKLLAYNLSPSFNWDGGVFNNDTEIEAFTGELGRSGFVWQFITLAGFHSNGLMTHNFVQEYAKRGMGAYVEMIQREEKRTDTPVLKHQTWSGAELMDQQMGLASGGASTTASMGAGVTESQFSAKVEEVLKQGSDGKPAGYRRGNSFSGAM